MYDGEKIINPNVTHDVQSQLTTMYTERAVHFIEQHHDKPFFVYLATTCRTFPCTSATS